MSSPRTALREIRDSIDDMMEQGDIHITPDGVRIDLRELLGKCDTLKRFLDETLGDLMNLGQRTAGAGELHLCPICGREAMDLQIGKCESCGVDFGGVNAELYHIACERLRGELEQLDELKADLEEIRKEKEADIARVFGQDKLDIAKEAFNKGYEAALCQDGDGEIVWENECQLVIQEREADNGCYKTGEMGLCDPKNLTEVQVSISSYDRSAKHEVFSKLEQVPVRITLRRVPGGNV